MPFDRWHPIGGKTFAFRVFRRHHTELNDFYWGHQAALRKVFSLTKPHRPDDPASTLFPDPKNERQRAITLGKWAQDYSGFDNFTRLSALIAATGYLEVLVRTLIDAACQSKPALLLKGGRDEIDGISILKKHPHAYSDHTMPCVKGEWQQRIKAYRKIFGSCPVFFTNHLSQLEKLRHVRNSVGHAFGRSTKPVQIGELIFQGDPKKLKQDALKSNLQLIYEAAKSYEAHLRPIIGSYEMLCVYHHWKGRHIGKHNAEYWAFKRYLKATTGIIMAKQEIRHMMMYYHNAS